GLYQSGLLSIGSLSDLLNGRPEVWALAIQPFRDHTLIGAGPGVFGEAFRTTNGPFGMMVGEAHNQAIESLAEVGLSGFLAIVIALLLLVRPATRAWREGNWLPGGMLLASIVYFSIEAPFRPGLLIPTFWVLCMFALANARAAGDISPRVGGVVLAG